MMHLSWSSASMQAGWRSYTLPLYVKRWQPSLSKQLRNTPQYNQNPDTQPITDNTSERERIKHKNIPKIK